METTIASYLSIAGTAHRRIRAIEFEITSSCAYPIGPQDMHLRQEMMAFEAIISIIRGSLAMFMLELSFSDESQAIASPPASLAGSEDDNGQFVEPL